MSKSYKRNRIEKLPPEIRYYIAEFVPHKNNVEYPYIPLFKNIILDWYNKYRVYDTAIVYRSYIEIYENILHGAFIHCCWVRAGPWTEGPPSAPGELLSLPHTLPWPVSCFDRALEQRA